MEVEVFSEFERVDIVVEKIVVIIMLVSLIGSFFMINVVKILFFLLKVCVLGES